MLTKVQVENSWRDWVNQKAEEHRLSQKDKFLLQDAIAKELQWFLDSRAPNLSERIAKYNYMRMNALARIHDFDRFWDIKIDFFKFILED